MDAVTLALIKSMAGGGSSLPPVTPSDNGKVLAVEDGAWAAQQKKFLVTLTPTAADFSGTMDKTIAEINAAYEAGQEIWFSLNDGAGLTYNAVCDEIVLSNEDSYPSFTAKVLVAALEAIVFVETGYTSTGTWNSYFTTIYSLTPAS